MKVLVLLLAALTFDVGRVTVANNPEAAAAAVTAAARSVDPCCPEWLCRILCGPSCAPCPPAQAACRPPSCCRG